MKMIDDLNLPETYLYMEDHTWAKRYGERVKIGISDYAQDQLGEIIYVELPQIGEFFEKNSVFGTVESVKATSELYMPVGGEVVEINTFLKGSPNLVNKSPYDKGWMIDIKPHDLKELDTLLTKEAYIEILKKED